MKNLRIDDIVEILKSNEELNSMSKKSLKLIVEGTFITLQDEALKGNDITISNFGKFIKVTREGISKGFGKARKFKTSRIAFKPFKASKQKG